jgi:hypothetical protein
MTSLALERNRRSRVAIFAALIGSVLPAAGCLTTPAEGDTLPSIADPITLSGVVTTPDAQVRAFASTTATGTRTQIASTNASHDQVDPRIAAYDWSMSAPVPASLWVDSGSPDALGCGRLNTYVSAMSGRQLLKTVNGLTNRVFGYQPLVAPPRGGLVIQNQADADGLRCVHVIVGDLTITDSTDHAISLPSLERVTGNLTVSYPSQVILDPMTGGCAETRQIHAPLLKEVGGSVELDVTAGGDFQSIDLGLEALQTVGQGLTVNSMGDPDIALAGLDLLQRVPGTLTVRYAQDTICYVAGTLNTGINGHCVAAPSRPSLLAALTSAHSVSFTSVFSPTSCVLTNLAHIDANLVLHANMGPGTSSTLTSLQTIGGDLRFDTGTQTFTGVFGATLQSVGGTIVLNQAISPGWPMPPRMPPLTAGGVDIENNSALSTLGGATLTLVPSTAPVTILNNPNLPQSDICDFVSAIGAVSPTLDQGLTCPLTH